MTNRTLITLLALALIPVPARSADDPAPGLLLRIYEVEGGNQAIPELAPGEAPNVCRPITAIDFGEGGEAFPLPDRFVTHIDGWLSITQPGEYTFRLLSDDGARLWLEGRPVIDYDGLHGPDPKDGAVTLFAGPNALMLRHFEETGGERLALLWKPPGASDFTTLPPDRLTHDPSTREDTKPGTKRTIPALRRGRPGDGTPVAGMHPAFTHEHIVSVLGGGRLKLAGAFIENAAPTNDPPVCIWIPDCHPGPDSLVYALPASSYGAQYLVLSNTGEWKRIFIEDAGAQRQGAAFRFSAQVDPANTATKSLPLELRTVSAMSNGFELELTKPLDPRCGWEAESYYIEQWPFGPAEPEAPARETATPSAQTGKQPSPNPSLRGRGVIGAAPALPRRDGVVYPVKSASVSADRKKVFLEIENLKPGHVVYIRLLPPCVSEDGELPWSTEAWYTLNVIPTDRMGQVLPPPPPEPQNILTDAERAAGWRLLFDGRTPAGWRGWKKNEFPAGWQIKDGCLVRVGPGGDICTDEQFDNFELTLEWRIAPAGNSGIFFRASEEYDWCWRTAPEMQVLDNAGHADGRSPLTSAGSNYALHAPTRDATVPVGFFNQVRLVVNGPHVEHWLNGEKVVAYELGSPAWEQLVAASKFKDMPHYGREPRGHIVLQDHGDKVWYRNIKLRPLPPAPVGE